MKGNTYELLPGSFKKNTSKFGSSFDPCSWSVWIKFQITVTHPSVFTIWILVGNNHGPTLPLLSWKLPTPLYMDVSSWVVFTSKTLESHSFWWHTIAMAISVTTLLHSIHQKKQHRKILVDCDDWRFYVRTLHPKEGGPSRYHGALAVCRKAERRNLGSWRWSQHPSPLNDTGI